MSVGHIHHRATKALREPPMPASLFTIGPQPDDPRVIACKTTPGLCGPAYLSPDGVLVSERDAHPLTHVAPSNSAWGIEKLQKRGLTGLTEWEHTHVVTRPDEPRFRMFSKRLEGNFSKFVDGPDTRKFTTTHGHAFDSHPMSGSMPHEAPSIAAPIVLTHAARKKLPQHTSTASPVKY